MFRLASFFLIFLLAAGVFKPAAAAELTVNKIAAVVNGEMISLHELRGNTMAEAARQGLSPNDPKISGLMREVLETMINNILIRQEAERLKLSVTENEVQAELKNFIQRSRMSPPEFEAQLKSQGATLDMLKERIRDNLLRQRLTHFMVARKIVVMPDEVAAYYQTHQAEFMGEKTADFSIIVFPPSVKVQDLVAQMRTGVLPFEEAAKRYSLDASKENGGHIGAVPWSALTPDFHRIITALKDGEISPPIRIERNHAVIRRNAVTEGGQQTLEQATPRIEEILREPRMRERFAEYTQQLRNRAVVDIRL